MPTFRYAALDSSEHKIRGTLEATSATNARFELLTRDLQPVALKEQRKFGEFELTPKRLKAEDVMFLSRQLGAFVRSGIPLIDALESIAADNDSGLARKLLTDIADRLRGGAGLADALEAHAAMFPVYYVPMIRSAELTGNLDQVLEQLSRYIERDLEARRAIRSALTYPLMILAMSIVTVFILVLYVLPKFQKFFESFHAQLPLPTRMLLGFSKFIGREWLVIGFAVIAIATAAFLALRTERGKLARDRMVLRIPLIKVIVRYAVTERFCRILGSLIQAGVSLPTSMVAATEAANNRVYQRALAVAGDAMMKGDGIARPIADTGLFPMAANQMIRVGEATGAIEYQLATAADFYEIEVAHRVKRLTTLFEPAVIVFMGLIVGFVALAMVSAMYGIFRSPKVVK